jgi:hypothetical protein
MAKTFSFEEATAKPAPATFSFEEAAGLESGQTPLPEGIRPSEAGAGRSSGVGGMTAEQARQAGVDQATRRGAAPRGRAFGAGEALPSAYSEDVRAEALRADGAQTLRRAQVKPSATLGGRGTVVEALDDRANFAANQAPPRTREEAISRAVGWLDRGATEDDVAQAFGTTWGLTRDEIAARAAAEGLPGFGGAADRAMRGENYDTGLRLPQERPSVTGVARAYESTTPEDISRFTSRVGAQIKGVATNNMVEAARALGADAAAASRFQANELRRTQDVLDANAPSEGMRAAMSEISQAQSIGGALSAMARNPAATGLMLGEAAAVSLPLLAMSLIPGGRAVRAVGVGGASAAMEYGSALGEELDHRGVRPTDVQQVNALLQDQDFMDAVRKRGALRGLTVGTVDGMTALFAGTFIMPTLRRIESGAIPAAQANRAALQAWTKELTTQAGAGAGGEALGQAAVGEYRPADIVLEAGAELPGAITEARSNLANARAAASGARPSVPAQPAPTPYAAAATAGFHVEPPLTTDTPQAQRKKVEAIFDSVAAMYGIPARVVEMARKGAEGKPLAELGPAYARFVEGLQIRGLAPTDIAPEALEALAAGAVPPPPVADGKKTVGPDAAVGRIEATLRAAGALPSDAEIGLADATPLDAAAHEAATSHLNDLPQPAKIKPPRLQNRNRSDAAYVQQMQAIAKAPDPGRLGFSRDFASGAPVVLDAGSTPGAAYGRTDYVTTSKGRRLPVRYAVVEADSLLPSNTADGVRVEGYAEGMPSRARVVAGNGRAAGLVAGYDRGSADGYRSGLAEDAALHGIDAETLARFKQPVLVREMRAEDVTADIGDESNVSGIAERSSPEVARDDARRIDLAALEFDEAGNVADATVRGFVDSQPVSEQTALRDAKGNPTRQAHDRLVSAIFAAAYENDALLALQAQAADPEARTVLAGLVAAAPQMVRLRGAGDLDIRPLVAEAAVAAVNARRRGIKLADMASQMDLDASPEIAPVLEMFARNGRSAKRIGESLRAAATLAYNEAQKPAEDLLGAVPKRSREQILEEAVDDTEGAGDLGQQAGAEPAARDARRQAAKPDPARGRAGVAQERAAEESAAVKAKRAEVIELRKRVSVLESLRACLAG